LGRDLTGIGKVSRRHRRHGEGLKMASRKHREGIASENIGKASKKYRKALGRHREGSGTIGRSVPTKSSKLQIVSMFYLRSF